MKAAWKRPDRVDQQLFRSSCLPTSHQPLCDIGAAKQGQSATKSASPALCTGSCFSPVVWSSTLIGSISSAFTEDVYPTCVLETVVVSASRAAHLFGILQNLWLRFRQQVFLAASILAVFVH